MKYIIIGKKTKRWKLQTFQKTVIWDVIFFIFILTAIMWRTPSPSAGWKSTCSYKQDLLSCFLNCSWIMQQSDFTLCILTALLLPPLQKHDDWIVSWCFCLFEADFSSTQSSKPHSEHPPVTWWDYVLSVFLEEEQQRCFNSKPGEDL